MGQKPKVEDNILDAKEQEKFLESARSFEGKLLAYGLLYTGMRVSEFIHMKRGWLNWGKKNPPKYYGAIEIPKEMRCDCYECKDKRNGYWRVKTKRSARTIPIPRRTLRLPQKFLRRSFPNNGSNTTPTRGLEDKLRGWGRGPVSRLPPRPKGDIRHDLGSQRLLRRCHSGHSRVGAARNREQVHSIIGRTGFVTIRGEVVGLPRFYWFTVLASYTLGVLTTLLYYRKIRLSQTLFWVVLIIIILLLLNEKYSVMENLLRNIF